jgi:hypothetical protein
VIYRQVGPRRDRVHLHPAELRVLDELERSLDEGGPGRRRRRRRFAPARLVGLVRRAGRSRLAPGLLPLGLVVMVAAIPVSVPLSFAGSLLAAGGLAATFDRVDRRFRRRA